MWQRGWEMNARQVAHVIRKPRGMGWKKFIGTFLVALCCASAALAGEPQVLAPGRSISVAEPTAPAVPVAEDSVSAPKPAALAPDVSAAVAEPSSPGPEPA